MSKLIENASMFTETENGALTYNSTGSEVLNFFSMGGALRTRDEKEIINLVDKAYNENPRLTLQTLLYLRDIRGGQGEKRVFKVAIKHLKKNFNTNELIKAIVEVGSWKDVFDIFTLEEYGPTVKKNVNECIKDNTTSLMFKWMPSISGSKNKEAEALADYLCMSPKLYRKTLSCRRGMLELVETKMCSNNWGKIEYEHVPSKAGLIYKEAFKKHDDERYSDFINKVNEGKAKINTGTLYPYEIVRKYFNSAGDRDRKEDKVLETLWKNLPNYCKEDSNTLVVADTSGSMTCNNYLPMSVAFSLAVYFSERNKGIFANEYITFSERPTFFKYKEGVSLYDKITDMYNNSIVANTNIQKVFDLVLKTAKDNHISEAEMPKSIVIVSDMEFDVATIQIDGTLGGEDEPKTNFEVIKKKYAKAGYKMPTLVFWNVDSRQNNVPVKMDENGTVLVSGASPSIFKMVAEGDINPVKFLMSVIDVPRYKELAEKIFN